MSKVSPTIPETDEGDALIELSVLAGALIVPLDVSLYPLYLAVMVTDPAALYETVPPLTAATEGLLDVHVADEVTSSDDSSDPSAYVLYVALSDADPPVVPENDDGLTTSS